MNINKKHKLLSKFLIFLMSAFLMLSITMTAFAATQTGNGGRAFDGAATNTFAAGMPLSEIYFVTEKFSTDNETIVITDNTSGALEIDHSGEKVRIKGGNLSHNTLDNQIKGQYQSTFKDAAILPDGTVKDVVLTFDIGRVLTAKVGNPPMPNHVTIHHNSNADKKAINIVANTESKGTGVTDAFFGVAVEKTVTISVDGAGDFVVPFFGFNQNRNSAGSYRSFREVHGNDGYDAAIETAKVPDTANTFYPAQNDTYISVDGETFIERGGPQAEYDPPNQSGGQCGSDTDGYRSGFATIGKSGFSAVVNSPCSENTNNVFPNNQYIALGDLIHRIWSGSGPHGKIETGKSGTGTGLAGGSFTGAVPSGFPAANTETQNLMRYVVPDAKEKVTYTMTPDKGYTMDTLVVDGTTYTVPKIPESASITTYDGNGALTYLGGGKFTFEFTNANTQDHEIYVTWRKATADIEVNKVWNDDSKASGVSANVKLTWGSNSESKPVPASGGLVHKWEDMDVFEYDANGVAGDPITYTLEEDPDPVSDDYAKGVWRGTDKAGNAADAGFNLTDDSKDNKAREKDDPFTATVTNTLKKDVEITKKWNDQNNKYNTRPSDVAGMFKLYNAADGTEVTGITPTVTAGTNEHTIKWAGLPKIDASGNELTYYAVETDVPAGYTSDPPDGRVNEGGEIENVLETKDVSITKTWNDEGDIARKRPAPSAMTSSFTLYNDQAMTSAVSATPSVTDNGDNAYTVKWTGLPAKDAIGSITYYVKETTALSEYEITDGADGVSEDGIITNKFTIKPPTGKDDKSYGGKGDPQEGKPEFTKGTGNIPPTDAYTLLDGDTPVDELTIPGEGRYTIDKDTGAVTFIPEPDFTGPGTGVTVQVTDEFGEKAIAEYTPTVVNNTQTVSKEQKINYHYSDGSPVLDSEGNPLVRTRSAEYTREGNVDPETGEITSWDPWVPVKFDNIDSPGIEGYTPDKATVTGGNFTPDNWPADVDVIYTKESPVPPKPDDPTPPDDPADDPADDYPDVNPTDDDTSADSTGVRTGDAANVIVWIVILAAVIAAVTYLIIRRRTNE